MSVVHFILDEWAVAGQMNSIDVALGIGRGYDIRLNFYLQSTGQLKKICPDNEITFQSNTTSIVFGVADHATAETISNMLGQETIVVESGGTSYSRSTQWNHGSQPSTGGGDSTSYNDNWGLQARKLLTPDEVMNLHPRTAIVFTPGIRPIKTTLLRYYDDPIFNSETQMPDTSSAKTILRSGTEWMR